jgi:hypothetical protein
MSNDRITGELKIGKDLDGRVRGLIKVSEYLPGTIEETLKILQDSWFPIRNTNQAPPEYKARERPLHYPAGSLKGRIHEQRGPLGKATSYKLTVKQLFRVA